MSNIEIKGTIKKIYDTETFASGFQKRLVILTTDENYPQELPIEFLSDKVDLPDAHKEGSVVTVGINLRSRTWTDPQGVDKYFPSFNGWKIIKDESAETAKPAAPKAEAKAAPANKKTMKEEVMEDENDDLPF